MKFRLRPKVTPHVCTAVVAKVQHGATLVRHCDGRVRCWCPFLCDATSEACEFPEIEKCRP